MSLFWIIVLATVVARIIIFVGGALIEGMFQGIVEKQKVLKARNNISKALNKSKFQERLEESMHKKDVI